MSEQERDVRFGHDLRAVQDHNGVDLLLLKRQLALTVEERLIELERQIEFASEIRGAAQR